MSKPRRSFQFERHLVWFNSNHSKYYQPSSRVYNAVNRTSLILCRCKVSLWNGTTRIFNSKLIRKWILKGKLREFPWVFWRLQKGRLQSLKWSRWRWWQLGHGIGLFALAVGTEQPWSDHTRWQLGSAHSTWNMSLQIALTSYLSFPICIICCIVS